MNFVQPTLTGTSKPSAVVVLIQDRAGNVLAVSRKGLLHDLGLPGGKIDPTDQSPEAALSREVWEEVGLRIEPHEFHFVYERIDPASGHVAWCYGVKNDLRSLPQAVEPNTWVGWVPPSKLLEFTNLFHEYNLGLFKHVGII